MSTKQAINDKLQGSVVTYLRSGVVVNNQINVIKKDNNDKLQGSVATYLRNGGVVDNQIKKGLLLSVRVKFF